MPCDSIVKQQIRFENAQGHLDLLVDALREQGYAVQRHGELIQFSKGSVAGTYRNGKFDVANYSYGDGFNVDAVKRSFARGVVKKAAKQYGWSVTETGNNKLQIRKRA